MNKKHLNKILVWIFLWTAIWGIRMFVKNKKRKKTLAKIKDDIILWFKEMKLFFDTLIKKYGKKK